MKLFRSSKVIILDADDNVLVLRRSKSHPRLPLKADLSGGIVHKDETHESGLIREIFEETKIEIPVRDLILADMYRHLYKLLFVRMERSLFAVRFNERPEVMISWEHDRFDWIPLKKVKDLERPIQKQLDRAIKKGFFKTI
ncbi:MAG: hypothetical protein JWM52_27 [Candidatus Saccharibacteria bacterium]|nr:hypothetical protein [Candidatus Saccharibacteria bacterium]